MDKPNLAIVIPYYKLTYFDETLKSLAEQSNKNFSLYIGNDCSTEDPDILIEKFSDIISTYKRFNNNLGAKSLTKQWERCIDNLVKDEEWIMILCDDDLLDNNVVEEFYNLIDKDLFNNNVIKFSTRIIDEKGLNVLSEHKNNIHENSIKYIVNKILNRKRSTLSEHIFNKNSYYIHKFKDFELAFGSDDVAWVDYTNGGDFLCINNAFVNYRKSTLSISNNEDDKLKARKMKGIIDSYMYILKHYYKGINTYDKKIFVKRVYNYIRAIYSNRILYQFLTLCFFIKILGVKQVLLIIRNNRNYYEQPD